MTQSQEWRVCRNVREFAAQMVPILKEDEAANNLPLGILQALAAGDTRYGTQPFMAYAGDGGSPALMCLMTPPRNLILSSAGPLPPAMLAFSLDRLKAAKPDIPGVIGRLPLVEEFAEGWCHRTGRKAKQTMAQRIYALRTINPQPKPEGEARWAMPRDVTMLTRWFIAFAWEALGEVVEDDAEERVRDWVAEQSVLVWDLNGPVSMARASRPTGAGIAVNMVYTPKEHRRHGYASACVEELSRRLLNRYEFITLFTDLANPTSNSIYQKIGYEPVCDWAVYEFVG